MDKRLAWLICCLLILIVSPMEGQAQRSLKPQPNMPIDCASYDQPCTGTECVSQHKTYDCASDGTTYTCENDTQNYVGGAMICCTGKNLCGTCVYNGRTLNFWSYNAVTSHTCVPNP